MQNDLIHIQKKVLKIVFPFKDEILFPQMLFVALDLKIISYCLDEKKTLNEIAHFTKIDSNKIYLVIESLRALSILKKYKTGYQVYPSIKNLFSEDHPSYIGHTIENYKANWQRIYNLEQYFSSEAISKPIQRNQKETEIYLRGVLKFNGPWIKIILRFCKELFNQEKEILDIGGGHGIYATRILGKHPRSIVTILDLENAVQYCRKFHRDSVYFGRMHFIKGDILKLNIAKKYDIIMIHDLLHYFSPQEKAFVIKKSYAAIRDNGHLIISKFHLTETKRGLKPDASFCFAIKNFIHTSKGYLETDEETLCMLEGLPGIKIEKMTDRHFNKTLLIAKKTI